jgi:hypothetical protein
MQTFETQQAGKERIARALTSLAIARQASDFGDAAQRVYLHLLADLDAALVARACDAFARTPRREFEPVMPTAADLRAKVDTLRHADAVEASKSAARLLPPDVREPTYGCFQCQDAPGGWILLRCPETKCDRHREHAAHTFTVRCPHWLKKHAELIRDNARKAIEEKRPARPEFDALLDVENNRYRYAQAVTQ